MRAKLIAAMAVASMVATAGWAQSASAAVVFSDNFNSYAGQLNWTPPANWTAPSPGSVDLIGSTSSGPFYDLVPGNGGYVDLDGTSGAAGSILSDQTFAAGKYTLSFDLAGNARGDVAKTTVFSLGGFASSLTLASGDLFGEHTYTFTTTGGKLDFADLAGGNGNIGNLLDNVSLSSVPEPSTWAMFLLGFGAIGWTMRGRRRDLFQAA